ncbi:hypothetical protein GALMADRAFT_136369 [Galerina marginata CBS 339.88]|uniref:Uncharacterized protein n=1 Tax=Galerina marginata (strain CBS 339.88) TaxID=685588 RepID=A0A067TIL0_GALM3|nr:hypothetical protein GALMADRAFT_136369 [Galerina marginata CBS 339.88]
MLFDPPKPRFNLLRQPNSSSSILLHRGSDRQPSFASPASSSSLSSRSRDVSPAPALPAPFESATPASLLFVTISAYWPPAARRPSGCGWGEARCLADDEPRRRDRPQDRSVTDVFRTVRRGSAILRMRTTNDND